MHGPLSSLNQLLLNNQNSIVPIGICRYPSTIHTCIGQAHKSKMMPCDSIEKWNAMFFRKLSHVRLYKTHMLKIWNVPLTAHYNWLIFHIIYEHVQNQALGGIVQSVDISLCVCNNMNFGTKTNLKVSHGKSTKSCKLQSL